MSALKHTLLLLIAAGLAYLWLTHPVLKPWSLQAFAASVFIYFVIKRLHQAKIWHLLPRHMSWELAIATFAFLLLIGSTGNLRSPLYPLSYVHLFFIVLTSHPITGFIMTGVLIVFHYALTGGLEPFDLVELITLPLLTLIFLFAKQQHEEVIRERSLLTNETASLEATTSQEKKLEQFLQNFTLPKLEQITQLMSSDQNKEAVLGQIHLLQIETSRILKQAAQALTQTSTPEKPDSDQTEQADQTTTNQ